MTFKPLRIGVVGPGRIVRRVMKDFHKGQSYTLAAVASRSLERAQTAAREYGAPLAFGSYEELAACKDVDLVYIAVPHPFHCPVALQMMDAGKHVICEKPMALNECQARAMVDCARKNGVFLMEAMWTRFFPAMRKMVWLVKEGEIGQVNHVYAVFSGAASYDPKSRAFDPTLGGGALLDIGVYPLMAATHLLGWEVESVQGACQYAPSGVDMRLAAQLKFPGGATAQIMGGMDACAPSHLLVYGSEGYIVMEDFWHPTAFTLFGDDGRREEYRFPAENEGFHYEFEEAARCVLAGFRESPLMTHEESVAVSRVCDSLRREAGILYPGE